MTPIRTPLGDPVAGLNFPENKSYTKGYQEYLKGNTEKARTQLLSTLSEIPNHYAAQLALGYVDISEENWEQAERNIRKALELQPAYQQAHFALGHVLESKQEYQAALDEFIEVERLNPEYPGLNERKSIVKLKVTEHHLNEGRRLARENPQQAIEHLKQAHDLAPEVPQIPAEIADIHLSLNNCPEASKYLEIAREKMPDNLDIKRKYADCLMNLGEHQRAMLEYQELLAQQPDNAELKRRIEEIKKVLFVAGLPLEYQSIPQAQEITRSQFAAYLILNLDYLKKYSSHDSQIIVDSIRHWAQKYILKSVNLGLVDLFPNRTFQPNLPLSRMELAKAVARVLQLIESEGRPIPSSEVSIPDLSMGNAFYSTVAKTISAGVISLDADGKFHPYRKVAGSEVVSVVNRLRTLTEGKQ